MSVDSETSIFGADGAWLFETLAMKACCFPWKRLDGSELDGSEHFEHNCQNVPGAAGAAAGTAAGAAAASALYAFIT